MISFTLGAVPRGAAGVVCATILAVNASCSGADARPFGGSEGPQDAGVEAHNPAAVGSGGVEGTIVGMGGHAAVGGMAGMATEIGGVAGVLGVGGMAQTSGIGGNGATTPMGGGAGATGALNVKFTCASSPDRATAIQIWRIANITSAAVTAEFDLKYWYTANGHKPTAGACDLFNGEACIAGPSTPNVPTVSMLTGGVGRPNADSLQNVHFRWTFSGPTHITIQTSFHYSDWTPLDFSDDYSCNLYTGDVSTWESATGSLVEWGRVALYQDGELVWGAEP